YFDSGAAESAELETLAHFDGTAEFFRREKEFFGCESEVVSLIDLSITVRRTFVEVAEIRLDARRLVDDQNRVAQMIENTRVAIHRDWNQPLPTRKRFSLVRKSGSIAQGACVTLGAP